MLEGRPARRWLRPLGLLALALGLAVGQPLVLVAIPFGLLAFVQPSERTLALVLGAVAFGFAFVGAGAGAMGDLDRGWAILVGGWFAALTLGRPGQPFLWRALVAVGGGTAWAGAILLLTDGWEQVEWLVRSRIEASATATLELSRVLGGESEGGAMVDAVARTAELQATVFPALVALSTLAALGVAWWLHVRLGRGSDRGLGSLAELRFADGMIWLFIAGLVLGALLGWTEGWGRVGSNLLLFTGGLYVLRGAGVLLFVTGGVGWLGGVLLVLALVFAAPVVLSGALAVGLGDTWFDLRTKVAQARKRDG